VLKWRVETTSAAFGSRKICPIREGGAKMFRSIFYAMLMAVILPSSALAQESGFGLGVIAGDPTGICFKHWMERNIALDGAVAWSVGEDDALHLHVDYLVHNFKLVKIEEGRFPIYYGLGCRIIFGDDDKFGARIPLGMNYLFENTPLDIFLEIVPVLDLAPSTELNMNGAIGIRYFFPKAAPKSVE
jgi:hypothetical protein